MNFLHAVPAITTMPLELALEPEPAPELERELELELEPELELELELALGQFTRICFLHPSLDPWPASLALRAQRCTPPS